MAFAVVKGTRMRVTKTNKCGFPLEGAAHRLVTDAFIRVNLDPAFKERNELEQENAEGRVCVKDATPATRKHWNIELQLCNADPDLFSLLASWTRLLGSDGKPIGFRDRAKVDNESGVAIEVWTGGEGADDCPLPEDDESLFSAAAAGNAGGYLLFGGTEFQLGSLPIEAAITTFTMTGMSMPLKHWARGPYNVAATDAIGTPGRLLVPAYDETDDNHLVMFRTPVAPPEVTDGAVPLAVESIFDGTGGAYYVGGPANAPAAAVAPAQPDNGDGEGEGEGGE